MWINYIRFIRVYLSDYFNPLGITILFGCWIFSHIAGRGCGTLTPIKYYDAVPKDTNGITCALVKPENQQKRSSDDANISVKGKFVSPIYISKYSWTWH